MSKIVMPKNSALLDEIKASMKVYYDNGDWMSNDEYVPALQSLIGDNQDRSAYTKKAQIPAYFGFVEWEDINNNRSKRRLTSLGRSFYSHWINNETNGMFDDIVYSLENNIFGRNNFGCPDSDSDVEPVPLIIRAIIDLNFITKNEIIKLLWTIEDSKQNYTDAIRSILEDRRKGIPPDINDTPTYYSDNKPITILLRWGFLVEGETNRNQIKISDTVLKKYKSRLENIKIFNVDKTNNVIKNVILKKALTPKKFGLNKIYYGAPGCGKSRHIKDKLENVGVSKDNIFRVTFHPEYANCDFIGQIMPEVRKGATGDPKDDVVIYKFNPGPFSLALEKAYNTEDMVYLIIEEINRGNAAAIFGDTFQLLDRIDDKNDPYYRASEYPIKNPHMEEYLKERVFDQTIFDKLVDEGIYIPSNLTIYATMNTSDQNVFTLDTAFKRRWSQEQIKNDIVNDTTHPYKNWYIPGTDTTWETFVVKINDKILENKIQNSTNEDKRLGKYFVSQNCLTEKVEDIANVKEVAYIFVYKVLEYIWNDVCKIGRDDWFDTEKYRTLEDLIDAYVEGGKTLDVFEDSINFKDED